MEMKKPVSIFWFRRDLRLKDNVGLYQAMSSGDPVLLLFIFDTNILSKLSQDDARVNFIYDRLIDIHNKLLWMGSSLLIRKGDPKEVFRELCHQFQVKDVFANKDYEPYGMSRDASLKEFFQNIKTGFKLFNDHLIFEPGEILKKDGKPYTVQTPFKKKWLEKFSTTKLNQFPSEEMVTRFVEKHSSHMPSMKELGFSTTMLSVPNYTLDRRFLENYEFTRDYPSKGPTSNLSVHLRFGTVSIREVMAKVVRHSDGLVNELIWREFFMQILFFYPHVVHNSFKPAYDRILWRNNEDEFQAWCSGETGYPMVDAGMRQLNQTGQMHNRLRMVAASFLCKHLLIDWRWGETYFADKLLDFELSSNNGNWQWAAGTGCDAAPYSRVFNPTTQQERFDPDRSFVSLWIPELNTSGYPDPIVDHSQARLRAIETYKKAISPV